MYWVVFVFFLVFFAQIAHIWNGCACFTVSRTWCDFSGSNFVYFLYFWSRDERLYFELCAAGIIRTGGGSVRTLICGRYSLFSLEGVLLYRGLLVRRYGETIQDNSS